MSKDYHVDGYYLRGFLNQEKKELFEARERARFAENAPPLEDLVDIGGLSNRFYQQLRRAGVKTITGVEELFQPGRDLPPGIAKIGSQRINTSLAAFKVRSHNTPTV